MKIKCACRSCNTEEITTYRELIYKGYMQTVEVLHTECYDCGYDFMTIFQIKHNASQTNIAKLIIEQGILNSRDED